MDADAALQLLIDLKFVGADQADAARAALNGVKTEVTESAEETGKLEINHRALHRILHMLGHETVPEFGTALTGLMYGPIGALLAVGAGFEYIQKKAKEAEDAIREAGEASVKSFYAQEQAMQAARVAADDYARSTKGMQTVNEKLKEDESIRVAVMKEQVEAQKQLLDVQEKLALASAKGDKIAEAQIREIYEGLKGTNAIQSESGAIAETQRDLSGRAGKAPGLASASDAAADASRQATAYAASAKPDLDRDIEYYKKLLVDLMKKEAETFGTPEHQKAQDELNRIRGNLAAAMADEVKNEEREKEAKRHLDEAIKAREDNNNAIKEESAAIRKGVAVLYAKITGAESVAGAQGDGAMMSTLQKLLSHVEQQTKDFLEINARIDRMQGM